MREDLTDDELMVRGADGDVDSFRVLVERWQKPLIAFLARMLGSPEEAQDLGQETFLRICRQAGRYRPEGRFRSWLFRIAGNLVRSRLRRRRILRWVRFDPESHDRGMPGDGAEQTLEKEEAREKVRTALSRLPDRQRQAIILRQYEDMSYREIASAMNTTVSAVQTLLHRAMTSLRKDLLHKRTNL